MLLLALCLIATGGQSQTTDAVASAFESAFSLHQSGNLMEAADIYTNIIAADPSHAGAHHFLAQIVGVAGDLDAGVRLASVAATLEPYDPFVWNTLGEMHRRRGYAGELSLVPLLVRFRNFARSVCLRNLSIRMNAIFVRNGTLSTSHRPFRLSSAMRAHVACLRPLSSARAPAQMFDSMFGSHLQGCHRSDRCI